MKAETCTNTKITFDPGDTVWDVYKAFGELPGKATVTPYPGYLLIQHPHP